MAQVYLMMNKPKGYVCSAASDSHKTVYELLPPELQHLVKNAKRGQRLHTIGRLDADTTGLLLFTTDGMFSHQIAASAVVESESSMVDPESSVVEPVETTPQKITKTYQAVLQFPLTTEQQSQYITRAAQGLTLPPEKKAPEQKAAPATITFVSNDTAQITINEGKFHEVRRIFKALGNEVKTLERIAIGPLTLPEDLLPGTFRPMTESELSSIMAPCRTFLENDKKE